MIGRETLVGKGFPQAFELLSKATEELPLEFIMRDFPNALSAVTDCSARLGPVDETQVAPFLRRLGYKVSDHNAWENVEQPEVKLGAIDGHREDGIPTRHTWYAVQGCLFAAWPSWLE